MEAPEYRDLEARVRAITRPVPQLLTYYCLALIPTLFLYPFFFVYYYFHYHTLHYLFDDDGVSMGYGIWFRRELHLTYARMQDIHLSQNLVERWLGIGTVTVQTAGGGDGGDLEIVGTRDFEAIRDYLYARLRGVHEAPHAATATAPLLVEIRDELRAATRALTKAADDT